MNEAGTQAVAAEGRGAGVAAPGPTRAFALDALRGLAILGMVMSGLVPERVLPAWMYHAQDPPPLHEFNPHLAGLTWVDLVFPFFLFSMGAAIPLALTRRLEEGVPRWRIVGHILIRGFLLGAFALYVAHIRPWGLGRPTTATWLIALLGFALLFPILTRLPERWSRWLRAAIRLIGWAGAIVLMASLRFHSHHGGSGRFSVERSDIIIVLLANAAVFGSLAWLITRNNLLLRLGFLGVLLGLRLSAAEPGWVQWVAGHSPIPWMFELGYLGWLFIVLPGTIIGDMLMRWGRERDDGATPGWSRARTAALALLMPVIIITMLAGLQSRWLWQSTVAAVLLCVLGWWLAAGAATKTEQLIRSIFSWATYGLLLGLALEPYEGGIKKVPDTMSYYFVAGGLAMCGLIAFLLLIEVWGRRRRVQWLIDAGANPMIAYVGAENLILPIFALTRLDRVLEPWRERGWLGVAVAAAMTLLLALVTGVFTRRRVFWRT